MEQLTLFVEELWASYGGVIMLVLNIATLIVGILVFIKKAKSFFKSGNEDMKGFVSMLAQTLLPMFKEMTLKQDIQPILESKATQWGEKAIKKLEKAIEKTNINYKSVLKLLIGLIAYFDNSVGVPEEIKQALRNSVEEVKKEAEIDNTTVESTLVVKETSKDSNASSKSKISR